MSDICEYFQVGLSYWDPQICKNCKKHKKEHYIKVKSVIPKRKIVSLSPNSVSNKIRDLKRNYTSKKVEPEKPKEQQKGSKNQHFMNLIKFLDKNNKVQTQTKQKMKEKEIKNVKKDQHEVKCSIFEEIKNKFGRKQHRTQKTVTDFYEDSLISSEQNKTLPETFDDIVDQQSSQKREFFASMKNLNKKDLQARPQEIKVIQITLEAEFLDPKNNKKETNDVISSTPKNNFLNTKILQNLRVKTDKIDIQENQKKKQNRNISPKMSPTRFSDGKNLSKQKSIPSHSKVISLDKELICTSIISKFRSDSIDLQENQKKKSQKNQSLSPKMSPRNYNDVKSSNKKITVEHQRTISLDKELIVLHQNNCKTVNTTDFHEILKKKTSKNRNLSPNLSPQSRNDGKLMKKKLIAGSTNYSIAEYCDKK